MDKTRIEAPARLEFGSDFAEDEIQDLTLERVSLDFHTPVLSDLKQ